MAKNPPKDSIIINVCIIPTQEVGVKCVELSQSLKSDGTMFVLDGKSKFAHMTVFMARFGKREVPNILKAVEKITSGVKSFLCKHAGYFMTPGRYFEVSYLKSIKLKTLHESLMESLKEYRVNPGDPFEEGYFAPYSEEQRKNAQETGYDLAYGLYRPHITLTRYKEGRVPENHLSFPPSVLSFMVGKICIYEADDNGAVNKLIKEFILK